MKKFTMGLVLVVGLFVPGIGKAQLVIDNTGCVGANFGIDAGVYSGTIEHGNGTPAVGTTDWFLGATGLGVIDESNPSALQSLLQGSGDPTFERRMKYNKTSHVGNQTFIDALYARDNFGGSGFVDPTAYETASKNAEDPAIWDPGPMNVLGKNDLIDVAGFMLRDGSIPVSPLWFYGLITRAEPGGSAYMDFEFYIQEVSYTAGTGFNSGGPDLGHTSFQFDNDGKISQIGDFIFNCSLIDGGTTADIEIRIWVSYQDYMNVDPVTFDWGPAFDGAFQGAPYGYASILPNTNEICGIVNLGGTTSPAPPWGTKNTKYNTWETSYAEYGVLEVGANLSDLGLDPAYIDGQDTCNFPYHTFIVKTRSSASFTSQLKDFAGPFRWASFDETIAIGGSPLMSCLNTEVMLYADPPRTDLQYTWSTEDGIIQGDIHNDTITAIGPGTYTLLGILPTGCPIVPDASTYVDYDPFTPFFESVTTTTTVSCTGSNGTVDLTVTGGTTPYSYLWSNGSTKQDLTGLAAGTYTATITEHFGCTITATATVGSPTAIAINPSQSNLDCYGDSDGSISLSVTGNGPLSYAWSNGNLTSSITNLTGGVYRVTVTDADQCTSVASYTISSPAAVGGSVSKTNDTQSESESANGTIQLTPSGGTAGYTYSWGGPNGFTSTAEDITGLFYGAYTVTITDSRGCLGTVSTFIYEPEICNDGIDNDGDGLNNCFDSDCTPITPTLNAPSASLPCIGDTITYSAQAYIGYDEFVWTYPGTATLVSGQGTATLKLIWNSLTGGQVCVRGKKFNCLSAAACTSVLPVDVPPQPGLIYKTN